MEHEFDIIIRARLADLSPGGDFINLYCYHKEGEVESLAQPLTFKQVESFAVPFKPFLEIDKHQAQHLMDDLWFCGLRPSEGTGSAGQLNATQNHLLDMRKIVFHRFGITI